MAKKITIRKDVKNQIDPISVEEMSKIFDTFVSTIKYKDNEKISLIEFLLYLQVFKKNLQNSEAKDGYCLMLIRIFKYLGKFIKINKKEIEDLIQDQDEFMYLYERIHIRAGSTIFKDSFFLDSEINDLCFSHKSKTKKIFKTDRQLLSLFVLSQNRQDKKAEEKFMIKENSIELYKQPKINENIPEVFLRKYSLKKIINILLNAKDKTVKILKSSKTIIIKKFFHKKIQKQLGRTTTCFCPPLLCNGSREKIELKSFVSLPSVRNNGFFVYDMFDSTKVKTIYKIVKSNIVNRKITFRNVLINYNMDSQINPLSLITLIYPLLLKSEKKRYFTHLKKLYKLHLKLNKFNENRNSWFQIDTEENTIKVTYYSSYFLPSEYKNITKEFRQTLFRLLNEEFTCLSRTPSFKEIKRFVKSLVSKD